MNRALQAIVTCISMLFLTNPGFAYETGGFLYVHAFNKTKYTCTITHQKIKHGYWFYQPPDSIAANAEGGWTGSQTAVYGPDMVVTLKCGGYSFTVENRQNLSLFIAGNQHCKTYNVDKHLSVTNKQTKHASIHEGGIAEVTVSLKGGHLELSKTVNKNPM